MSDDWNLIVLHPIHGAIIKRLRDLFRESLGLVDRKYAVRFILVRSGEKCISTHHLFVHLTASSDSRRSEPEFILNHLQTADEFI